MRQKNLNSPKKVIFRCDGATLPEIGSGHVIRDIVIANKLVEGKICNRSEISFVIRRNGVFALGEELVLKSGYHIEKTNDKELEWNTKEESEILADLNPTILFVDRLSTELDWMSYLKKKLKYIITMDDVGPGSYNANLAINPILYDFSNSDNRLYGYDYLILKPLKEELLKSQSKKSSSIVASFGGHDHRNLTGFFLDVLAKKKFSNEKYQLIEVLVGNEDITLVNNWKITAKEISRKDGIDVDIIVRPEDFVERLAMADFAVLSGGLTIFDAISLGIPAIGLPQYQHQLETLKSLNDQCVLFLGSNHMDLDPEYFDEVFDHVMQAENERHMIRNRGPILIDRKGTDRLLTIISDILK